MEFQSFGSRPELDIGENNLLFPFFVYSFGSYFIKKNKTKQYIHLSYSRYNYVCQYTFFFLDKITRGLNHAPYECVTS